MEANEPFAKVKDRTPMIIAIEQKILSVVSIPITSP
jgi:hypothetical protein